MLFPSFQVLALHEFPLLERKCLVQCGSIPTKLLFLKSNEKFYAMFENKAVRGFKVILISIFRNGIKDRQGLRLFHVA